jgi:UDP:flavonoid glycosyltransferase YjiC (YdhE family)
VPPERPDVSIVLAPVSFGYGTTVRCLAVAEELCRRGHRCVFLAGPSIRDFIRRRGFPICPIPDVVVQPHRNQKPEGQLFAQEGALGFLARQLAASVAALRAEEAQLVIFSNSLTAAFAAGVVGIPSISIFQPAIMQVSQLGLALPMLKVWLNLLRLRQSVPLCRPTPSAFLGSRSYIPSIPPLIHWPLLIPPAIWLHRREVSPCGALLTQTPTELPPDGVLRQELHVGGTPFVYATVGGAIFDENLIDTIARGLRQAGVYGLLSGGDLVTDAVSRRLSDDRVRVLRFVPNDIRAIKVANALIWHGGHQTMLEAVACGTPAIGLPYQLDQFTNVSGVVANQAGRRLTVRGLTADLVASAVRCVLACPQYRQGMQRLQRINERYGGVVAVADAAEDLMGARPAAGRTAFGRR